MLIENLIIAVTVTAVVYGIRYSLWEKNVPANIQKMRWVIAIAITLIVMIISIAIQSSSKAFSSQTGAIYFLLMYTIANALDDKKKNDKDDKLSKKS
jgi:multisubunit Na+/H+ antiporter MnhB subunit